MEEPGRYAIEVANVCKTYGEGKEVLKGISMHVEKGKVYGFLGSSGCGKTTLLSCILGLKPWQQGEISVLGKKLRSGAPVQNQKIGYMPQEYALQDNLTPEEIIRCYGYMFGISKDKMGERWKDLCDLLGISSLKSRLVSSLSGGQRRRVSLAVALIHSPDLLILDEPTVGLDPLLRVRIWNHLYDMTNQNKVTIIVTTHYVEELRRADKVGVMRKGRLIAEEDPNVLMYLFKCSHLQEAVLKVCRKDEYLHEDESRDKNSNSPAPDVIMRELPPTPVFRSTWKTFRKIPSSLPEENVEGLSFVKVSEPYKNAFGTTLHTPPTSRWTRVGNSVRRILAYCYLTELGIIRDLVLMSIMMLLPLLQIFTTLIVIGVEPKNINFGVINNEVSNWASGCDFNGMGNATVSSCLLIDHLSKKGVLNQVQFERWEDAEAEVVLGKLWGYIDIPPLYSQRLLERGALKHFADNETIDETVVNMRMDNSDFVMAYTILSNVYSSLFNFLKELSHIEDFDFVSLQLPMEYRLPPVYGSVEASVRDYAAPVVTALAILEVSYTILALVLLHDKFKGTLERALVAGVGLVEILVAMIIAMIPHAIIQTGILYLSLQYGLSFNLLCSPLLFLILCVTVSVCGSGLGLLTAILCLDKMTTIITAVTILPTLAFYMGIFRPVESIPYGLRITSYLFPTVSIVDSFRSGMARGVSLFHPTVWPGFVITGVWIFVIFALCVLLRKRLLN